MKKYIINNEEEYEKALKKKIRWEKAFTSLQPFFCSIVFTGGIIASWIMAVNNNPYALHAGIGSFALLGILVGTTTPIAVKVENSLKKYEEELQRLEESKSNFVKDRTMNNNLLENNTLEKIKTEVKAPKVEETLEHSYVYDEMADIPTLKLPQAKKRIRKR